MPDRLLIPEVQKFIKDHQYDDPFTLSLKSKPRKDFPLKEAIEQIHALQKARQKVPTWANKENIIWPSPLSVEQSSSELTARFKADLIHGKTMVDLAGGMGVDTSFFAEKFEDTHYVELDPGLAALSKYNFGVLQKENITVHHNSADIFLNDLKEPIDAIYVDPSRRNKNRKVFKIEDCQPNLYDLTTQCLNLTNQFLIKLSPLVDLSLLIRNLVPTDIWVVAVKNEVKEVLCLIQRKENPIKIHAVDLYADKGKTVFEFNDKEEAKTESTFSFPLEYIYEPSSAILKSGAFKLVGRRFGLEKIHVNTHLYTSNELIKEFQGRIFLLKEQIKSDKKEISRIVPNKQINVLTRNYPLTPAQLKNKLGLKDGGENFLIGTTLMDSKKALLFCERV